MISRVVLIDRLTKDPVLRRAINSTSVVFFTIACIRRFKQEGQPNTGFINTVAWNKTADIVLQYTHKGSLVGVEGRIQTRSYGDQSGKRVYVTEVVADGARFLKSKSAATSSVDSNAYVPGYNRGSNQGYQSGNNNSRSYSNDFTGSGILDVASDDLPF